MLCFEFFGEGSPGVSFCEETICYEPDRSKGLSLSVCAVVRVSTPGATLQVVHPRTFSQYDFDTEAQFLNDGDDFPYSFMFYQMFSGRVKKSENGSYCFQALPDSDDAARVGFSPLPPVQIALKSPEHESSPFTCHEISFPGTGTFFFRIRCRLLGKTYNDLVEDDDPTGMRFFKVYGAEYVHDFIGNIFLPSSKLELDSAQFADAQSLFTSLTVERRVIPKVYSIIGVDNPDYKPARMKCLNLTDDLVNLTEKINPAIHEHPLLKTLVGKIFWYATKTQTASFFLQMVGPALPASLMGQ